MLSKKNINKNMGCSLYNKHSIDSLDESLTNDNNKVIKFDGKKDNIY